MLHAFAIQEAQLPHRMDVLNSQTVFGDDTNESHYAIQSKAVLINNTNNTNIHPITYCY